MAPTASSTSPNGAATCYHGARLADGERRVIAHDAASGWRAPLVHIVTHAPISGFSWGSAGAGAADLARSLLVDALGSHALCPACAGRQFVVWRGPDIDEDPEPYDPALHAEVDDERVTACLCRDGFRDLPYHGLKVAFVARLPDHWKVGRDELLHWLLGQYEVGSVPQWLLAACGVDDLALPEPS
jgi:hypothetical protein